MKHRSSTRQIAGLIEAITPLFGGKPPDLVGATLADLLARWLACHVVPGSAVETVRLRRNLLAAHIQSVKTLTEINASMLGTDEKEQAYADQGSESRKGNQSVH